MKYFVILIAILTGFSVISIQHSFAEEEILILVENDVRKVYYTGENITSAFFDPKSASVIFETGENAKLDVKAPQVYRYGGQLFVLINGEEVIPKIDTDDCFYYVTFTTQSPEKIELIFSHWPEATEVVENCETFTVPPLKQMKLGISQDRVTCRENLLLVFKPSNEFPVCVKPATATKLIDSGWIPSWFGGSGEESKIQPKEIEGDKNPFPVDEKNKIDLTNPKIPRDSEGRIDYDTLIKLISKPYFSKLLTERNIKHNPDDIVLMTGPRIAMYTEYSSSCGYIIADSGKDYWLKSNLDHDTLTEAKIMDKNPDQCRPNYGSCFCEAQTHMAENTLKELSYFDPVQEKDVAKTVLEYITQGNYNLTPKFLIGKYNLDLGNGVTAFCGEFWGKNNFDYFQGAISNRKVVGIGIEDKLPKLCAISNDTQYFGKVLGEK